MTTTIEESVELAVPARTAYNQWTQFDQFPSFLSNVESVEQIDDRRLTWRARIGGRSHQWEAEICEQIPDKRIAWRSLSGAKNAGVLTFHRLADDRSKVMLQLEYEPEGLLDNVGDVLGIGRRSVSKALHEFKEYIESRGSESGAWRGTIPSKEDRPRAALPSQTRAPVGPGRRERRVEELMLREVRSCHPSTSLSEAARLLRENDCGSLPVVSEPGAPRLIAMITDRDICMAAYHSGRPLQDLRVSDAMSREVRTCGPHDELSSAEEIMSTQQVRRLPVVDGGGILVGLLTLAHLALAAGDDGDGVSRTEVSRTLAAICQPSSASVSP